ncbi:MAG TPA: bifunctional lysylphosphatidylglycerol flippase/synthetase MprF [Gemmatimonadaceae bacterium]|nr:bifunctional lysylphosphatidylglycerol flippase/synthetase MprF [Gemmatimonadaceae bacterium]
MSAPSRSAAHLVRWIGPGVSVLLFFVALHVLRGELHTYGYREISRTVRAIPARMLLEALGITVLSYLVLPGYDALGLAYAGRTGDRRIAAKRIWLGASTAYGLSQTLGFPAVTGSAVRYRFWSSWGLTSAEIARAVAFAGATFTAGVMLVSGAALLLEPAATLARTHLPYAASRAAGAALLGALAAYVAWSIAFGGRPMRAPAWLARRVPAIAGYELPVPRARLALAQLGLGLLDWSVAAAALYVLLPAETSIRFLPFVGIFVLAQFGGIASNVPGGLGVFETLMVLLLGPHLASRHALAAVIAFRAIYYLIPFVVAVTSFSLLELRAHGARFVVAARAGAVVARVAPAVVPMVMSAATFAAGALLLWSGATPSVHGRLEALDRALPLGVIEASHLLGSLAGTALLVLAWALRHRINAAWGLTVALLGGGIAASLLKGLDWEEALALAVVLAILLPFRGAFYRKSALTAEPLEPGWVLAIVAVVGASVWLGLFSYRHVEYAADLWWSVGRHADAPRFLRASVTSAAGLALFGFARLMRHAPGQPAAPSDESLARAARIAAASPDTGAYRALLGDKSLLFASTEPADVASTTRVHAESEGFVQYAVEGRSWIALGDPVVAAAPDESPARIARTRAELAWRFREAADAHGGWPVFYEVGADTLPLYIDLGLSFLKLGEEARVDLGRFSLDGGERKGLRRVLRDAERARAEFSVVPAERVPELLPSLRAVSAEWLAQKRVREKGFSLGWFDEDYLRRFPVAVVTVPSTDATSPVGADEVVAFANLWPGGAREELSVDLMRFGTRAPRSTMDYLFTQLMLWGKAEGYRWFDLGMAPLAGLEARQLAPLWARAGAWLYRHGEHFYNYQGVRRYKEKFDPVWEPKYLASAGGLARPRILANVATLISGGVTGIVRK